MNTDYQKLCRELFGTDDVEELKKIAEKINRKNPRNAGRKRRFSNADIQKMKKLQENGTSLQKIAEEFHTSRQMVGRMLTNAPPEGCSMRMTYMYHQKPCTVIDVDFLNEKIYIQNKTDDLIHRAFGILENPGWEDFKYFLEDRCFPKSRGNCKQILKSLGLSDYDPLQIVEKTQGRMAEDDLWIKIRYLKKKDNEHVEREV